MGDTDGASGNIQPDDSINEERFGGTNTGAQGCGTVWSGLDPDTLVECFCKSGRWRRPRRPFFRRNGVYCPRSYMPLVSCRRTGDRVVLVEYV